MQDQPKHPWKERMIVGILMVLLALLGLVLTDIHENGGWQYWRYIVFAYAILTIWLNWYLRRTLQSMTPVKIWHEVLHWIGLILSVYLISVFVDAGILGRFPASLVVLILLSFSVFLAGVYIETTFIPIGILLGLLAAVVAFFVTYIFALMLPLAVICIGFIYWVARHHKKELT